MADLRRLGRVATLDTINRCGGLTLLNRWTGPVLGLLLLAAIPPAQANAADDAATTAQTSGDKVYIVQLEDPPVASYRGGIRDLQPTSPAVTHERRLDPDRPASVAYRGYLTSSQDALLRSIHDRLGRNVEPIFRYQVAFNGFALVMNDLEARRVATLPGVVRVAPETVSQLHTDVGPQWIGAPAAWNLGVKGEGVIVGILDTGLNLDHPSFADIGGDGYDHVNPRGAGTYAGLCQSDPANWTCNDKLIGYWIYTGETTDDSDGHGSHTASTAAGNVLAPGTVDLTPYTYSPAISGVAPHANVVGYDVCEYGCSSSAILAALDQVILDGVDVVNYSIGSASNDPWTNAIAVAFLSVTEAGIVAVTSAGNSGPGASTLGSPADAPWMLTTGNATHNRSATNILGSMTGGDTAPPPDLHGGGFSTGSGAAPIVYAGDFGDALCLAPFAPATWLNGEIVVCDRGINGRVEKGFNVLVGGAGGYVLANSNPSESIENDVHHLPGVHLGHADGQALKSWLASGSGHAATIFGTSLSFDPANGDIMNSTSSRGPDLQADVVKPDLVAPGTSVLAAVSSTSPYPGRATSEYGIMSGTSMASPHAAGAAALLRQAYPGLTPAEVRSALMSSADPSSVLKQDGTTPADPFDRGAGRVNVEDALDVGLVLDETAADFVAANPALGGDPTALNLASLADGTCCNCGWVRSFKATMPGSWQVTLNGLPGTALPSSFAVVANQTQNVTVDVDTSGLTPDQWYFGELQLHDTGGNAADASLPVAVKKAFSSLPELVDVVSSLPRDAATVTVVSGVAVTALTATSYGLVPGTTTPTQLSQDATNWDPYDNLNDGTTLFFNVTVPADGTRLVAEVIDSAAPDLDLFVGSGPTPSAGTRLCSSATSGSLERCDLRNPAPGDYWVLVQSYEQSSSPPDRVVLSHGVVAGPTGNLTVTGPPTSAGCSPFDLDVEWYVPAPAENERWYGAFSIGTDAGNPSNLGTAAVDLVFNAVERWLFCATPNQAIPDGGSLSSTLSIPDQLDLTDVDVSIDVSHTFVGDLIFTLEHVGGATTTLIDRPGVPALGQFGCSGDDIDVTVDDSGPDGDIESQCDNAPAIHGNRRGGDPAGPALAAFIGEGLSGDWRLTVSDNAAADTGTLNSWCVDVATAPLFADGFESGDTSAWSAMSP